MLPATYTEITYCSAAERLPPSGAAAKPRPIFFYILAVSKLLKDKQGKNILLYYKFLKGK
jgi:hypothetical protein